MIEEITSATNQNSNPMTSVPKPSADFNFSQKLTNISLNGMNFIPQAKTARVTLEKKKATRIYK
jgi:hypothetical protein